MKATGGGQQARGRKNKPKLSVLKKHKQLENYVGMLVVRT